MKKNYRFDRIEEKYDPEYDMLPDGPPVTWAEKALYDVKVLALRIGRLEQDAPDDEPVAIVEADNGMAAKGVTMLTTEELAQILIAEDSGRNCLLNCGKDEWGTWEEDGTGQHKHKDGCPFAIAYQVLTPEEEEIINEMDDRATICALARDLNIDDAVRVIARTSPSASNHDHGPNWYVELDDLEVSATFGAGMNSACVVAVSNDISINHLTLYLASEYGKHIETFRYGPWVSRLMAHANELRRANKDQRKIDEAAKAAEEAKKFEKVDF